MSDHARKHTREAPTVLGALRNAHEFLHFYFTGPQAEFNRKAEGDKNMIAEAKVAVEVAEKAFRLAESEGPSPFDLDLTKPL